MKQLLFFTFAFILNVNFSGIAQTALEFDGLDDYVQTDFSGIPGTTPRTFKAWIYLPDFPTSNICITDYGVNAVGSRNTFVVRGDGYLGYISGGTNANIAATVAIVPIGEWVHVAFVYDGTNGYLYQNGEQVGTGSLTTVNTPTTGEDFKIGERVNGGSIPFNGIIDELSVWDVALSQQEIIDYSCIDEPSLYDNLITYYTFNEGTGSILYDLVGGYDGTLLNMDEEDWVTSGICLPGYQVISFPPVPNHLINDPPFDIEATATSGLEVLFELISGPATLNGNSVTLTGDPGIVTITASQPGNDTVAPAEDVTRTFEVIDPTAYQADLTVRRPADGTKVYMTSLDPVILVLSAYIEYPDILSIETVSYEISGQGEDLTEKSWGTGYYTAEWTPPDFGTYSMTINAASTGGVVSTETVTFEVTDDITDINVQAFDQVHISTGTSTTVTQDFVFPTYVGCFDQIMAYLDITCPAGGCDPWDRIGSMEAKGPTGEWIEIIRYITPYGVPCDHQLDVTDYASIFQGQVEMRFSIGTDEQGFIVDVNLDFQEGPPQYKYSWVNAIWKGNFPFGDYSDLQPMDTILWNYEPVTEASKLKIFNTGHGWGDLNTGNAAEFYEATHKIKVNEDEYDQHLWVTCNPNPDGCQPQNGTWYFNRAGWCPGSIGYVYEYDLTSYVSLSDVEIIYEFYPGYVDYCHPNHPDCVTGVTCSECNSGFNPFYKISGNLFSYSNALYIPVGEVETNYYGLDVFPNPSVGQVHLTTTRNNLSFQANVTLINHIGQIVDQFYWTGEDKLIDLSAFSNGIYFIQVNDGNQIQTERIIKK